MSTNLSPSSTYPTNPNRSGVQQEYHFYVKHLQINTFVMEAQAAGIKNRETEPFIEWPTRVDVQETRSKLYRTKAWTSTELSRPRMAGVWETDWACDVAGFGWRWTTKLRRGGAGTCDWRSSGWSSRLWSFMAWSWTMVVCVFELEVVRTMKKMVVHGQHDMEVKVDGLLHVTARAAR